MYQGQFPGSDVLLELYKICHHWGSWVKDTQDYVLILQLGKSKIILKEKS